MREAGDWVGLVHEGGRGLGEEGRQGRLGHEGLVHEGGRGLGEEGRQGRLGHEGRQGGWYMREAGDWQAGEVGT